MRQLLAGLGGALALAACQTNGDTNAPPLDRFYFPAAIVHRDVPGSTEGVLFVGNANTDKRFSAGSIVALQLDTLGLPPLGQPLGDAGVLQLTQLGIAPGQSARIASFVAQMDVLDLGDGQLRLYAPTRSEGMRLYQVAASLDDAGVPTLACVGATPEGQTQNCVETGPSLTPPELELSSTGVPRAPSPYGVAVAPRACTDAAACGDGRACQAGRCVTADGGAFADVYVTHLTQADSPVLTGTNLRAYLVRVDSDAFTVGAENFTEIGPGAANAVAATERWVYLSGRILNPAPNLVRAVSRAGAVYTTGLEASFRVAESRGLAVDASGKRLYVVGRVPDVLLVGAIPDPSAATPQVNFVRAVDLPDSPNELRVIPRAGRGDLVAITSTSTGSLALYDDEIGDLVATVSGLGTQPFGLAVDHRGTAARIYVTNFGDGRVAVIDVPDLSRPQGARLVAHLGEQQLCLVRSTGCGADGGTP